MHKDCTSCFFYSIALFVCSALRMIAPQSLTTSQFGRRHLFACCLYVTCFPPRWTHDFAFDFTVQVRHFYQTDHVGQHNWLVIIINSCSIHFGVIGAFYQRGLYIFFQVIDKRYWTALSQKKKKISCVNCKALFYWPLFSKINVVTVF